MFTLLTSAAAIALGAAFATAPRDRFETEIFIAAPPETVWSLLTDPAEHAGWNPMMRSVEGQFRPGQRVCLRMVTPSGREMAFRPLVLVADPGRRLRWRGRLGLPRLFDGEHYFHLIAEHGGTRLVHGERFRSLLVWFIDVQQFRPGFEAANEGLRHRAQSQHPGDANAGTTSSHAKPIAAA